MADRGNVAVEHELGAVAPDGRDLSPDDDVDACTTGCAKCSPAAGR